MSRCQTQLRSRDTFVTELAPEAIVRLETTAAAARRPARPAPAAGRGGRARVPHRCRGRRGDPHARGAGRAGDRRRRRLRAWRSRRCAATTSPRPSAALAASRPTAVNLFWALDADARRPDARAGTRTARRRGRPLPAAWPPCRRALRARHAALTHCNAGGLATGGYGSAVGALRAAWERGLLERVLVDETRPLLQGARLTAWELETRRHPARRDRRLRRRVDDGARRGRPDRHRRRPHRRERRHGEQDRHILSRRARRHHGSPLYVVAPTSTVDLATATGAEIPIEERDPAEVTTRFAARNPAFDVTPAALIAAIVTEDGVHRAPYEESLAR